MKILGNVIEVSYNGMLLVRATHAPGKETEVVDTKLKPIGHIVRVFGPVTKPYVSVRPYRKDAESLIGLIGKDIYLKEVFEYGKTKKNR